jgi:phospholipid-translocating ATPase
MAGGGRRRHHHFSKIHAFSCGKASMKQDEQSLIGGPGFSRKVYCNDSERAMSSLYNYGDNYVRTTKYTVATFLPKSLFEQFRRVANFYFLVVAILSFFPVAPYSAVSNVIPLLVVVSATMAKEFIEDFQRKKQVLFLFYSLCQI